MEALIKSTRLMEQVSTTVTISTDKMMASRNISGKYLTISVGLSGYLSEALGTIDVVTNLSNDEFQLFSEAQSDS